MGHHVIHEIQRHAGPTGQGHGFGGNGDVHPGQQLMDDLDGAALARFAADPVELA
ncbi:hypothetical protein D3C78_1745530 [compost metagenome]